MDHSEDMRVTPPRTQQKTQNAKSPSSEGLNHYFTANVLSPEFVGFPHIPTTKTTFHPKPLKDHNHDYQQPMTKIQMKMLIEGQEKGLIKPFIVRLKRLKRTEILLLTTGKPIKEENGFECDPLELPSEKPKQPIKSVLKKPENQCLHVPKAVDIPLKSSIETAKKELPLVAPNGNDQEELIKRYGKRFFQCMVKVKRLDHSKIARRQSKPKSKLSVSFSEHVEILGSNPRKSIPIVGSPKAPPSFERVNVNGGDRREIPNDASTDSSASSRSKRSRLSQTNGE